MAITLPTPLRVAAGIVASGIDLVRSLPEEIPALPVTLVGKAMQLSMKVQQEIADLATKGDEFLSGVLGGPQENPPWAQFDDEPPPAAAVAAGSRHKDPAGPAMPGGAGSARAGAARAGTAAASAAATRVAEGGKAPVVTPLARSTRLAPPEADVPAGAANSKPKSAAVRGEKTKQDKPRHDRADAPDASRPKAPGLVHPSAAGTADAPAEREVEDATTAPEPTAPEPAAPEPTEPEPAAPESTEPEPAAPEPAAPESTEPEPPVPEPAAPEQAGIGAVDNAADDGSASPDAPDAPPAPSAQEVTAGIDSGDPGHEPSPGGDPADTADTGSATGQASASTTEPAEDPDDGPVALPDYDRMTLAQVRGYLRGLSVQEVQSLLDHEQSGENRAPFLTLLSNRLITMEHQES